MEDGNSLRDEMKDKVRYELVAKISTRFHYECTDGYLVEDVGEIVDTVFSLLHIDEKIQDMQYRKYQSNVENMINSFEGSL